MEKRTRVIVNKNKKKKSPGQRIGILCIVFFLVLVMSVQMVKLYRKNEDYKKKEEALAAELEEQQKRQEELVEYEIYTQSQQYVEDTAKGKLGMVYGDEIIFREKK